MNGIDPTRRKASGWGTEELLPGGRLKSCLGRLVGQTRTSAAHSSVGALRP